MIRLQVYTSHLHQYYVHVMMPNNSITVPSLYVLPVKITRVKFDLVNVH